MLLSKMVPRRLYSWRLLILTNGRMSIRTIRQTLTELSKIKSYKLLYILIKEKS